MAHIITTDKGTPKPAGKGRPSRPQKSFSVEPKRPGKIPGAEIVPFYWHPDRLGIEHAPAEFAQHLPPGIVVTRPPANAPVPHAWMVWLKSPRVTYRLCPGWLLLFTWMDPNTDEPVPLDARLYANLFLISRGRWGSGKKYFEHCAAQLEREKASKEKHHENDRKDRQREFIKSRRISTAGSGSRFAKHHDGTVVPSRSALNWHLETRHRTLPSEQAREEAEQRELQRDRR